NDSAAVLALLHRERPASDWYDDWLALTELAPALGTWTTARRYLRDSSVGEYAPAATADEFSLDDLEPRVEVAKASQAGGVPLSWFPRHLRRRRRIESTRTVAALYRALSGPFDAELHAELDRLEERIERGQDVSAEELTKAEQKAAAPLAGRLLARAATD